MNNSHNLTLISNSSAGLTMGSGLFTFLNENAGSIGLIITFVMAIITVYFNYKNTSIKQKEYELKLNEKISELLTDDVLVKLKEIEVQKKED